MLEATTKVEPSTHKAIAKTMNLKELSKWLKSINDISPQEKFELYVEERDRITDEKNSSSLDELLKGTGIKRYKK